MSLALPWQHLVVCSRDEAEAFSKRLTNVHGCVCPIIRGERCATEKALLRECARAYKLPSYFGHNWDALDECLCDLEWLPAEAYVTFVTECEKILPDSEDGFRMFWEALERASRAWRIGSRELTGSDDSPIVPFHVVIQCSSRELGAVRARLAQTMVGTIEPELLPPSIQ
ncbi:MAG: barstar family protein [Phycisphaerae bacterium]|nr:barstar family protein [Phycisphaerae bacterium]